MKIEKVKERLKEIESSLRGINKDLDINQAVARLCRDLGHELPRRNMEILREFRREATILRMFGIQDIGTQSSSFVQGILFALGEVAAAFEENIEAEKEDCDILANGEGYHILNQIKNLKNT